MGVYIELQEVEVWKDGAPEQPVIRMQGGLTSDGELSCGLEPPARFEVGERIVAFLREPPEGANQGRHWVTYDVIFHEIAPGRYSNGTPYTEDGITADELRSELDAALDQDSCD